MRDHEISPSCVLCSSLESEELAPRAQRDGGVRSVQVKLFKNLALARATNILSNKSKANRAKDKGSEAKNTTGKAQILPLLPSKYTESRRGDADVT